MKSPDLKKSLRARSRRALLLVLSFAIILGAAIAAFHLVPIPRDLLHPQDGTTTLLDRNGRKLAALPSTRARAQQPIGLHEMGPLPAIMVALEDARFYSHRGIDLRAVAAAFVRNARAGRILSGGSTITQQLIKLASGRSQRSWGSKLYESAAAIRLETIWTKDRILEEYLNRCHYGNRMVGPAAAARAYFGKQAANLTAAEAVYLAGLPQAPTKFNPWLRAGRAEAKYQRSIAQLSGSSHFAKSALPVSTLPPRLLRNAVEKRNAPHFVDALLQQEYPLPGGTIETTLDLSLQRFAEEQLELQLTRLSNRQVRQGAVVVLDAKTGAIRAMVGSRNYAMAGDGQVNGATTFRSCGSTLKPFLYLRAIDERIVTAATLLPDTPDAIRAEYIDYDPSNYDRRFLGPVRVREALANSLNVPAVVLLSRLGARKTYLALRDCGIKFARPFSDYGAGMILGNAEIRLLDLTAAFTVFAGNGLAVEPRYLPTAPSRHRFIASAEAVSIVSDILSDNDARRNTFGPFSPLAFENNRIPCKTGTSSGFRDAWAVGVTAQHAVGVWVGNSDGRPMQEIAAVTGSAPIWRAMIDYLLQHGDSSVPVPIEHARLTRREVDATTGLLPTAASPILVNEWFLTGTEPSEDAGRYWRTLNGRSHLILPSQYALWCKSGQNRLGATVQDDAPLAIVSPRPGATFSIDPHLLRSQQALQLIASASLDKQLEWSVDGEPIVITQNGYFWPLVKGRHDVEVKYAEERVTAQINVE